MASHAQDDITWYLLLDEQESSHLAGIRQWSNLKVGFDGNETWLKDFDYTQIHSSAVKSIPYKRLYYSRAGKLFPMGSELPERIVPSLLWTPIERALPIKLQGFNHHFFGIREELIVRLISSEAEKNPVAMIVDIKQLGQYITSAPAIRLSKIKWAVLNNTKAFLFGTPLLPVNGEVFWLRGNFVLPAGFDLDLYLLADLLDKQLNPENDHWMVWNPDNTYFEINKRELQPLSLGSFRLTTNAILVH